MSRTFVIGARLSKLSLRQVEVVSEALHAARPGPRLEEREIHTEGARTTAPLAPVGGPGGVIQATRGALAVRAGGLALAGDYFGRERPNADQDDAKRPIGARGEPDAPPGLKGTAAKTQIAPPPTTRR